MNQDENSKRPLENEQKRKQESSDEPIYSIDFVAFVDDDGTEYTYRDLMTVDQEMEYFRRLREEDEKEWNPDWNWVEEENNRR